MEKTEGDTFGVPYDYRSIMHYSRTTWTKNGANTMEAKYDTNQALGGQELSKYDILKLKHMYHCHGKMMYRIFHLVFSLYSSLEHAI